MLTTPIATLSATISGILDLRNASSGSTMPGEFVGMIIGGVISLMAAVVVTLLGYCLENKKLKRANKKEMFIKLYSPLERELAVCKIENLYDGQPCGEIKEFIKYLTELIAKDNILVDPKLMQLYIETAYEYIDDEETGRAFLSVGVISKKQAALLQYIDTKYKSLAKELID